MRILAHSLLALAFLCVVVPSRAQIITNFGSSELSSPVHTFSVVINSSNTALSGTDDQGAYFVLNSTIPVSNLNDLQLTGNYTGSSSSTFAFAVYDDSGHEADFTGNWSSFAPSLESSVTLVSAGIQPSFDFNITGFTLASAGSGSESINFVADSLTAVPEPSSLVLLGLGAVVLWAFRKHFNNYKYRRNSGFLIPKNSFRGRTGNALSR